MVSEVKGGPLRDYRVVDASTFIAGPIASMGLADMGASVIKVEPPQGDPARRAGRRVNGKSVLFASTNRGKRSIVLDLKDAEDLGVMGQLIKHADVFLENWRPGVAERLGLADSDLAAWNDQLVHVSLTAFGGSGPRSQAPGFDGNLQALSGLAWYNSHGGRPEPVRSYLVDKVTGGLVVQSVLAALLRREREGSGGSRIDINMLDAAAYFNFSDMFERRTVLADEASFDPDAAATSRGVVRTADGFLMVAPGTSDHLRRACAAVGHPEWFDDFDQLTFAEIGPLLNHRLEERFVEVPTTDALRMLEVQDVPACAVLDFDAHFIDPQILHNETYGIMDSDAIGAHRYPHYPARFTEARGPGPMKPRITAYPSLNQHGDEIRSMVGSDGALEEKKLWS